MKKKKSFCVPDKKNKINYIKIESKQGLVLQIMTEESLFKKQTKKKKNS